MNDSVAKEAITREQEKAFLNFVKDDKHFSKYYEGSVQRRTWSESNEERGKFCPSSTVLPSVHQRYLYLI